jgi:hypothetical protein
MMEKKLGDFLSKDVVGGLEKAEKKTETGFKKTEEYTEEELDALYRKIEVEFTF